MNPLQPLLQHLRRLITRPIDELTAVQRSVRYLIELLLHCVRQLRQDRAEEMAAALTYRTIFALIPLFVLGLILFRVFGGLDDMRHDVEHRLFQFLGLPNISYVEPWADEDEMDGPTTLPATGERQQVRVSIQNALADMTDKVADLNFASIGVIGVVVFLYAGLGLAISVEYDFNIIFRSARGRSWALRIPIYWSLITLGSGLVATSIYLTVELMKWVQEVGVWLPLLSALNALMAFVASWLLLLAVYLIIPTKKIDLRSALIGSALAALMWEIVKWGFQFYVRTALPYSALYGALGLIPLFLLWIYVSWIIVLFGAELANALHVMRHKATERPHTEKRSLRLPGDPQWLVPILGQIASNFDLGRPTRRDQIADQMNLPSHIVENYGKELQTAGLIHFVGGDESGDSGYVLARPPEAIRVGDVLQLGQSLAHPEVDHPPVGWNYMQQLEDAQRAYAADATLRTVVSQSKKS